LPPKFRGRREDRVRAAPAVSRAMRIKNAAHEHTGSAESLRPSLRNGFTAYTSSSWRPAFLPPSLADCSARLTPAPGRRTHTISPYAAARSFSRAAASTAPCPSFATMADAPLAGQDARSCGVDLPDAATEIFLREGLDRLLVICPSCQFVAGIGLISSLRAQATRSSSLRGATATKQSMSRHAAPWIASRCLSSGAHSRDPLARNDEGTISPHPFGGASGCTIS
jgi:hypothetical protein